MKRACVIGWPIAHSRSPLIHGYWLKKYGIEGSYTKEAVEPGVAFEAFLKNLRDRKFDGANVTVPHKEAVYGWFRNSGLKLTASADAPVGAVNTLYFDEAGNFCGDNTDIYGFITYLNRKVPDWPTDRPALVLGAGGAASAVIYALHQAGVKEVYLANRTYKRAQIVADIHNREDRALLPVKWECRQAIAQLCGLIVNTTTLGMKGQGSPEIDFAGFDPSTIVYDLVYVPLETAFLASARAHGLKTVDGLGMLLYQAVPGFERWFGVRPEVTSELRALVEADIRACS